MKKMMKTMAMTAAVLMMISTTIQVYAATDATLYTEAQKLESGEILAFGSLDELKGFLRFYEGYRLLDYVHYQYGRSSDGKTTLALEAAQLYDRAAVEAQILAIFGEAQGSTAVEKAAYASKKVYNEMSYDVSYQYISMDKAITDRTGVCWHYAKIAMIMLQKAGVDCEVQTVKYQGVLHALCKCMDEAGEVFYIDPVDKRTYLSETEFMSTYVPVTLYQ